MAEFKIRVDVELNADDLEAKLKALGKEQEIELKLNTSKIESQLKSLKKSFKDAFKLDSSIMNDLNKIAKALEKVNNANSSEGGTSRGKATTSKLINDYKELYNLTTKLQKQLAKGGLGEDSIERTSKQIDKLKNDMSALYNQMSDAQKQNIDLFNAKQTNKAMVDMNSYLNKIENQATSLQSKLKSVSFDHIDTGKIDLISAKLEEIQTKAREGIDLDFKDIGDILNDLNKLSTVIKDLEKVENLANSFEKISGSIAEAGGDVEKFQNNIKDLENSATRLDGSFDRAFSNANNELKAMRNNIKNVSSGTNGIFGTLDDFRGNFAQFTLAEIAGDFIADGIRTLARGLKDTVVETDSAITDLNKVYEKGLKGDSLKQYLGEFTEVAKQTGKTSVDVIQGTAKAVQSGISDLDQALVFARQSAIFSNVGDIEQEQADTMLASIMSAYGGVENSLKPVREQVQGMGKDYSTLTKFMDLANYAGNNFAVSTADVGEALRNSASALQMQGVSMEESVGMAVALNEILQDAGRSGNALKSMSAGMSGLTVSTKDGTIQLTKAGKAMKEIAGIEVWNQKTGEVKDMYEVMDELSVKWDDLSEAEQTALGTAIAGKTQLTAFSALLSNWDTAKQYVEEYKQGLMIGSAEKENAQYVDSIAGKWNIVKENMKAVGNTLITSETAKGFLDGLIVATDGLDSFTKHATSSLSDVFGGKASEKWSDGIYEMLEKTFGGFGGFTEFGNKIATTFSDIFGGISSQLAESVLEMTSFGKIFGQLKDTFDIFNKGDTSLKELNKSIDERTDNINAIEEEVNSLKNQKQAMDELIPAYDELSKKENRSVKENQELAKMREQLADINPDLVLGYDQDGSPILKNLKLQSKELESQIKLKQQSQRLEENALAIDTLDKRTKEQKDYNKALQEYNDMALVSSTKRKDGLFGEEDLSDYAKRLKQNNEEVTKASEEAYQKRLEAHQQYITDEKAIQERYLNQLEQSTKFKDLTDLGKESLLTFADSLDWSNFSLTDGNKFVNQLSSLGEKITNETKNMGEFSKAITKIGEDYANGKTNLIDYTEALGEQYELAGKFDTESFTAWRQGLQSYADMTGDLVGANKAIDAMATSLNKVTGIDVSTWKTALSFDPAPIDASNKALQKFLNSYGTGIQNLGKGGLADTLTSQFETLQTSYSQMVSDLAGGKEIDVEYLINAKVNQPEPIGNLIDEIIEDEKVTEKEIEILLNAQAELLNTGQISQETIAQIAEEFNMTEAEVTAMLNVKTEVKETGEPFEQIKSKWDSFEAGEKILTLVQNAIGGDVFQLAKTVWDGLEIGEKVQTLVQKATGSDLLQSAKSAWDGLSIGEKIQTLVQTVSGGNKITLAKTLWDGLDVGEKIQTLVQKVIGSDLIKGAGDWFMGLFEGEKTQTLTQKATGKEEVESASQAIEKLPSKKEVTISIVQAGANLLSGIGDFISSLGKKNEQTVTVKAKVGEVDTSTLKGLKTEDIEINAKVGKVDTSALNGIKTEDIEINAKVGKVDTSALNNITTEDVEINAKVGKVDTSALNNVKAEDIDIKAKVGKVDTSALDSIKVEDIDIKAKVDKVDTSALDSIKAKDIDIKAKVDKVDTSALDSIKAKDIDIKAKVGEVDTSALNGISVPTIDVSAKVTGLDQVNALKSTLASIQNKVISLTVSGNALSQVNAVKTALSGIQSKSISITAGGNALSQINAIKTSLAGLQSKSISVSASVSGTGEVNALKTSIAGLQGKAVTVSASVSGTGEVNALTTAINTVQGKTVSVVANVSGTAQVNALTSAINKVKSKSVKVTASVSGTGAVQSLASAISSVRSKTVSVKVNRTVTTTERTVARSSVPVGTAMTSNVTPMNTTVTASDSPTISPSPSYGTVTASASNPFDNLLNLSKILPSLEFDVDIFKNLEESLKRLESELNVIDAKMENAFGEEKVRLLQQQIPLLRQQQQIQEKIAKGERSQNTELTKLLSNQGFKFDALGNITNYVDKLVSMEQNVKSLKDKYDKLNDSKNKNESATKSAQKAYDSANETLNETKKRLEDYFNTNNDEINGATEKWYEYQNAIIKVEDELRNLQRELKELDIDSGYKDNDRDIAMVENRLDMLDAMIDGFEALGDEKDVYAINSVLTQRIEVIKELQKEMNDLLNYENGLKNSLINELSKYGFKIRDDGSIENYGNKIKELKQTLSENEFEIVFEMVEEYLEKIEDTIPGILLEWQKLNNEITKTEQAIKDNIAEEEEKAREEAERLAEEMEKARKEAEKLAQDKFLKGIESSLDRVNNRFDELSDKMSLLEAQNENANGGKYINFLTEKMALLNQQIRFANNSYSTLRDTANKISSELSKYGVTVSSDGSNNLENFVGAENFSYLENLANEYANVIDQLRDMQTDTAEAQSELEDLRMEMEKARRDLKLLVYDNELKVLSNEFENIALQLDVINTQLEYTYGVDKMNKMTASIELMNKQLSLQEDMLKSNEQKLAIYQESLDDYGFEFDLDGNIINFEEIMDSYTREDFFDELSEAVEEYFDVQSEVRDLIGEYNELEVAIKDAYREQLEITQEIEGEITEIIEKEYEKRQKEIEEYTDARIKLLEKEKQAYKEMRDEQDYEESLDDQLKEIEVLRKQIETARRDTSISGQKRLAELTKELAEAEKELAEITQDKIDQDYENNIDKEIDKLEEEQDTILKALEEQFSEENIAKMVAEAMTSGFIEVNGELQSIQDVLIDSINKSADGYSVMADIIKNELVANLNVALNTMKEIENINDALGLQDYKVISSTSLDALKTPTYEGGNNNFTIGDTYLNISGNVSEDIIADIENLIDQKNNEMLDKITSNL